MAIFVVCDNHKIAQFPQHTVDPSWKHPICTTFEEAQKYCDEWLGYQFRRATPKSTNVSVCYDGFGSYIEIVKIGE